MKYFTVILFLTTLFSCQSREAREYNNLLDSTDRKVYRIFVNEGMEKNRLEALIARKPAFALSIAKKQASELRGIIQEIENANVMDISYADQLKKSTAGYYQSMLRLKELDTLEAQLMAVTLQNESAKAKQAGMDISNLVRQRMKLRIQISDNDQIRQNAKTKFVQENNIR